MKVIKEEKEYQSDFCSSHSDDSQGNAVLVFKGIQRWKELISMTALSNRNFDLLASRLQKGKYSSWTQLKRYNIFNLSSQGICFYVSIKILHSLQTNSNVISFWTYSFVPMHGCRSWYPIIFSNNCVI